MASTSETGHAKNLGNFELLIETQKGFGTSYQPTNSLITTANMQVQLTNAKKDQSGLITQKSVFEPIENNRQIVFSTVKPITRRVRKLASTCGASANFVKDVNTIVAKLLGNRLSKPKPSEKDPSGTSASQQSYDATQDFFEQLIELLKTEPKYVPNEKAYATAALSTKLTEMKEANSAVKVGVQPLFKAKKARNLTFYSSDTGICYTAQLSKDYIRGAFGFSSPEFKACSKITFKPYPINEEV